MKLRLFAIFILSLVFVIPVYASEVTGELTTGVQTGVGGTVIVSPTANPIAGTYTSAQSVTLVANGSSNIHYTTDSSTPTCSSGTTYSSAVSVSASLTIKALSCYSGSNTSSVVSFAYEINIPTPTPIPSGGGGGGGGGGGFNPTPTPTPTATQTPLPEVLGESIILADPANLSKYGLKEGNTVSATGSNDPDIYIVNQFGYKRLFLNPIIFNMYGHLKAGWSNVKSVSVEARTSFPTSGLFRNCETNDLKVYAFESTGEDTGVLHWVNMSGEQAFAQDSQFFKKVFCINSKEFNWYTKSSVNFTSLSQVPVYKR